MELIHIANATFSIELLRVRGSPTENPQKSIRLKWASKQKTYRIVKEQAPRAAAPRPRDAPFRASRDHANPS